MPGDHATSASSAGSDHGTPRQHRGTAARRGRRPARAEATMRHCGSDHAVMLRSCIPGGPRTRRKRHRANDSPRRHHDQIDRQAVGSTTTTVADERAGTVVPGPQSATQGQRCTAPTAGRVAAPWMRPAARRMAMAVRAVVFDVGGVLEHAIDTNLDGRWEQRLGLAAGEFFARLRRSGLEQTPIWAGSERHAPAAGSASAPTRWSSWTTSRVTRWRPARSGCTRCPLQHTTQAITEVNASLSVVAGWA